MDFDFLLHRKLRPGTQYDGLMPKTSCKSTFVGDGMTDFSIRQMALVVNEFNWQTEKIADLLEKSSLVDTVASIKDFVYSHFQYKADREDQMLRSPACSWFVRQEGIDCKSYAILSSCLLSNLGITHYIRKIKQPDFAPDDWTHVYVIVPKDQKTAGLSKGYYTIDGTLQQSEEPLFIEKSDLIMDHYVLNGPAGLQGSAFSLSSVSSIGNFISAITCGSSSFDSNDLKDVIKNIETYYNSLIARINQATATANSSEFSSAVCEFKGNTKMFIAAAAKNKTKGWNSCTSKNIDAMKKAFEFYRDVVGKGLDAWLNANYTTGQPTGTVSFSSDGAESRYKFRHLNNSPAIVVQEPRIPYATRNDVNEVMAFELTPYLSTPQGSSASTFNPSTFLSGLSTVVASFNPPSSHVPTSGNNSTVINPSTGQPYHDYGTIDLPPAQEAGMGTVGWLLIGGALIYGVTQFTNPQSAKAAKK